MLASPPPPAQEFLAKIREMIAAARARMRNFRFRPTLLDIPEDDYFYYQQHQFQQKGGSPLRQNPLLAVDFPRTFEVNESFRDAALKTALEPGFPPMPPQRRKKRVQDDDEQARFDHFRKDLYDKLQRLKDTRDLSSHDRDNVNDDSDSSETPPYENVAPTPPPKGGNHRPPPRPPPRMISPTPPDVVVNDAESVPEEEDSLCSPSDSLNSRGRKKLSVAPDQTLLEALDESVIFDSLQDTSGRRVLMDSLRDCPSVNDILADPPRNCSSSYASMDSLQDGCTRATCLRGFDAMEALRKDDDFVHVCSRDFRLSNSVEDSSIESDSLVVSRTASDVEYDPDYSEPSARELQVPTVGRVKRRFRSRAARNGKPQSDDVTIIEVGDSSGDVLNGKGNFVTLIELDTSESSN